MTSITSATSLPVFTMRWGTELRWSMLSARSSRTVVRAEAVLAGDDDRLLEVAVRVRLVSSRPLGVELASS